MKLKKNLTQKIKLFMSNFKDITTLFSHAKIVILYSNFEDKPLSVVDGMLCVIILYIQVFIWKVYVRLFTDEADFLKR